MQPRSLEQRVTMLEQQMQELRELPTRVAGVELQIVQLREEMQVAFSAIRSELREEVGSLHGRADGLHGRVDGLHGKIDGLRAEMLGIRDDLRGEIRAGNQETRDFMRMLYEHQQTNIRTIGEGKKGRKR